MVQNNIKSPLRLNVDYRDVAIADVLFRLSTPYLSDYAVYLKQQLHVHCLIVDDEHFHWIRHSAIRMVVVRE